MVRFPGEIDRKCNINRCAFAKIVAEFFMIRRDRRFKSFAGLEKEPLKKIFRHATFDIRKSG